MAACFTDIDVIADLTCELDGRSVSIRSSGRQTVVEVPDVATGLELIRLGSPRGFFGSLHRWKCLLDTASHRMEFRIRGRLIGRIGHLVGSQGWKIFGLPALTLKPLAIVSETAWWRRR